MKFRTEIEKFAFDAKIEYQNSLFFIGSCFASSMGERCALGGIKTMVNPFGVTYNPFALISVLKHIEEAKPLDNAMFRLVNGKWCSLMHHSSFDNVSLEELKRDIETNSERTRNFIFSSDFIFVTLGTVWLYEDIATGVVVNNCHKIAAKEFRRRAASVDEVVSAFAEFIDNSKMLQGKKLIFTVSPIRHLKDSLAGNSLSKATLRVAVDMLVSRYSDRGFAYFPSYEIMMDDLRDYRFYDSDMIHPSSVAVDYIFELFQRSMFTPSTIEYCCKMERLNRALSHRVIDSSSEAYGKFKENTMALYEDIRREYPLVENLELDINFKSKYNDY